MVGSRVTGLTWIHHITANVISDISRLFKIIKQTYKHCRARSVYRILHSEILHKFLLFPCIYSHIIHSRLKVVAEMWLIS